MPEEQAGDPREARAQQVQDWLEWPVIGAALLTIPIIVIQESHLGGAWPAVATAMSWTLWSVFLLEVILMLWLVPNRGRWARDHLIDLAVVILTPPFAPAAWQATRLFRLIRLLRLVRLFSLRRVLSLEGIKYTALIAVGMVIFGGAVFAVIERESGTTTWDGIWWAMTTVTTVGYGDITPHSDTGRILGMIIMFVGIGFVALLTAFIADRFINVQMETEQKEDLILDEIRAIRSRLDSLERESRLAAHTSPDGASIADPP